MNCLVPFLNRGDCNKLEVIRHTISITKSIIVSVIVIAIVVVAVGVAISIIWSSVTMTYSKLNLHYLL